MVVVVVLILTVGVVGSGFTVSVMALEVAVLGLTHAALLVSTQVMISPLEKVLLVYVAVLLPTLFPLRFH